MCAQNVGKESEDTNLWGVRFQSKDIGRALPQEFIESMGLNRPGTTLLVSLGRKVRTGHPKQLGDSLMRESLFHDYFPIHILSRRDVDELNHRIQSTTESTRTVDPLQFRPNLVIDQAYCKDPVDVDYWFDIWINNHQLYVVQKTPRCNIGNIILEKGVFDKQGVVTKTLDKYRQIDPVNVKKAFLGSYAIQRDIGYKVHVGDEVQLVQKRLDSYLPTI